MNVRHLEEDDYDPVIAVIVGDQCNEQAGPGLAYCKHLPHAPHRRPQ